MNELIQWIKTAEQLPDDEMTVLINTPRLDEPVWFGYHLDGQWYYVNGGIVGNQYVRQWAKMPAGEEEPA